MTRKSIWFQLPSTNSINSSFLFFIFATEQETPKYENEEMGTQDSSIDPMYGLRFLKSIHEGLPNFEALRDEFLQDKYNK